ncbi:topoisomerase II-associated protein PAT1 [Aspergillus terreus]|uniref:Topoisomerase II-associated protein PAT1 n=1 Tax=Aspergillus terreus TaxID=33178 RepID=A0A5M3YZ50_ASPTE|nr:hypothetical protein ATETN484_0004073600 [Aspergillus terreus]GFF13804.1 topoisomerase II-associated protein PAT1 [Aspergillus terreus]
MSTPNDLQALLASIRPRPSPSNTPGQDVPPMGQQYPPQYPGGLRPQHQPPSPYDGQPFPHPQLHGYRHPSVSTAMNSPSPANTPPQHGSDILSPNVPTPRSEMFPPHPTSMPQHQPLPQNPDRAVNLLNLLKFSQTAAPPGPQQPPVAPVPETASEEPTTSHARNISASDLVASLFGQQAGPSPARFSAPSTDSPGAVGFGEASSAAPTAEHTQDMLLRLLNGGQKLGNDPSMEIKPAARPTSISPQKSPVSEMMPSVQSIEESMAMGSRAEETVPGKPDAFAPPSKPSSPPGKESLFTYVNPFDQLAAASPRKTSPQPKSRSESPVVEVTEKTTVTTTVEPAQVMGQVKRAKSPILAEEQKKAVSQVVDNLVTQICRDMDGSASKSTQEEAKSVTFVEEVRAQETLETTVGQLRENAAEAKETPAKDVSSGDALADSWESAEDSAEKDEDRVVAVHNFPLKPFISISVKPASGKLITLRDDGVMDISRLKKEFDQLDRSLTSATSDYIVYALAKNGGLRIIRQDDGSDKQIFRSTRDRVFNVAVCTSQTTSGSSDEQALLGIGVSGTVYWAVISKAEKDLFELDALESESLIFPPFPASDENTSGGQLKTRAKRSSRHPSFFAIGRGKNIYVISPQAAADPAYGVSGNHRTVNTEKFFKERALKISTGKAGKDFMFSDDDTVVASLDKTGRLRFWDIREVVNNPSFFTDGSTPSEVRVPLNTFVTGSPAEKSWPTSVLFIDKLRPYVKSMALRYVLVGLKQNHTLQLWDIGLGKAVQELKFPHENESDAICSVAYHPGSGIIVVGHPTRNSIYFVHLSAPRYNLQAMSQASFIKRAAEKDGSLPKPESTACMSGIREISFASKGQLRSLDLLPITKAAGEESGLFELYVMHSRGVTCLNIKKEDLGWTADNKIIRPVNALEEGLIDISELQTFPTYVADEPSVNGDAAPTPTKAAPKEIAKKTPDLGIESAVPTSASVSRTQSPTKQTVKKKGDEQAELVPLATSTEKAEKKKKKKGAAATEGKKVKESNTSSFTASSEGLPATQVESDKQSSLPTTNPISALFSATSLTPESVDTWIKQMEALQTGVSTEFSKSLGRELEGLYQRFDEERRSWDTASAAKQDQVLRLVSSTLSDNVEKNLTRIVSTSIQAEVVPTLGKQLNTAISQQLSGILRQSLPDTVSRAVQQPEVVKVLSEAVGKNLAPHLDTEITKAVSTAVTPTFKTLTARIADLEKQVKHQEAQRQTDSAKIDQLTSLVRGLSDTVASMAAAQNEFQSEILKLRGASAPAPVSAPSAEIRSAAPAPAPAASVQTTSPEDAELREIEALMSRGQFEEGAIKWLQSSQQADLFDNYFIRRNPAFLTSLSPIVTLSVGVAVTSSLKTNAAQRLMWLDVVLQTINLQDKDIREVAPRIMEILLQRLNELYMDVVRVDPHDPLTRKIAMLSRRVRDLRA